jgi:hypothetical protein
MMNKKAAFTWLVTMMFVLSSCGPGAGIETLTPPPVETEETQPPETSAAATLDSDIPRILAYSFPSADVTGNWTIPLKAGAFTQFSEYAYTIPDWWENEAASVPYQVGAVEIGNGPEEQGQYVVAIDLASDLNDVPGFIASTTDADIYQISFQRTTQKTNPLRGDAAAYGEFKTLVLPDISVALSADAVCFVVNLPEGLNEKFVGFQRYCSQPGSVLSVREKFGSQYETMQASINNITDILNLDIPIETNQIISEMEDTSHLENCSAQLSSPSIETPQPEEYQSILPTSHDYPAPKAPAVPTDKKPSLAWGSEAAESDQALAATQQICASDITLAPVVEAYFKEQYGGSTVIARQQLTKSSLSMPSFLPSDTFITVAVVQIHQPIVTDLGTVFPGIYRLDYWFDIEGRFYAASITGALADGNTQVINQQVPAIPATFVNDDDSAQPGAQISACRIFGVCTFFQYSCS